MANYQILFKGTGNTEDHSLEVYCNDNNDQEGYSIIV